MDPSLQLARIGEAISYAARENGESHVAELRFARRLEGHPEILEARLRRVRYVCGRLGAGAGSVLLDIGSGVGLNSVLALLCGVGEVHAVEMSSDRLRSSEIIVRHLGLEDRLHVHGEDVLSLSLPSRSIDAAFSFELLEHVRSIGELYARLATWLRDGGTVYGRTGANGRNMIWRKLFPRRWEVIDGENYVRVREAAVQGICPGIAPEPLRELVASTRGELLDGIRARALEYRRTGRLPPRPPPRAPRDPVTGQYMERLLEPYETIAEIDTHGFRTSLLRPDFRNMTIVNPVLRSCARLAGTVVRLAHPASLPLAPWLELLSKKVQAADVRVRAPAARAS